MQKTHQQLKNKNKQKIKTQQDAINVNQQEKKKKKKDLKKKEKKSKMREEKKKKIWKTSAVMLKTMRRGTGQSDAPSRERRVRKAAHRCGEELQQS